MPRRRQWRGPQSALDEAALSRFLQEQGAKTSPHVASILSRVVSLGPQCALDAVPGLPSALGAPLAQAFTPCSCSVAQASHSQDGATTKLLIRLQDGMMVEAVIMRHDPTAGKYAGQPRSGGTRATLCISSQVGCQMACSFCATGAMGLQGDLSAAEILEQLLLALHHLAASDAHASCQGTPPAPSPHTPPAPAARAAVPWPDWATGGACTPSCPSTASSASRGGETAPDGSCAQAPSGEGQAQGGAPAAPGEGREEGSSLPGPSARPEAHSEAASAGEQATEEPAPLAQERSLQGAGTGAGSRGVGAKERSWESKGRPPLIRNVVFMGMGEPLNNYAAVRQAVGTMVAAHGFRLSPNHITVSTVGIVPRMLSFARDMPPSVNLALSLHAPTQQLRQEIVPAARAYPLPALLAALDQYQQQSGKRVFVEYVLLDGVNDSQEAAHQLGALLAPRDVVVNLIPYNPISAGPEYRASTADKAHTFQHILRGTYGLRTTVRKEMGQDIAGACGQLATSALQDKGARGGSGASVRDIEDIAPRERATSPGNALLAG